MTPIPLKDIFKPVFSYGWNALFSTCLLLLIASTYSCISLKKYEELSNKNAELVKRNNELQAQNGATLDQNQQLNKKYLDSQKKLIRAESKLSSLEEKHDLIKTDNFLLEEKYWKTKSDRDTIINYLKQKEFLGRLSPYTFYYLEQVLREDLGEPSDFLISKGTDLPISYDPHSNTNTSFPNDDNTKHNFTSVDPLKYSDITFSKFEMPPPPFSDREEFPIKEIFPEAQSFGHVDKLLRDILMEAGYKTEGTYNTIPRFHYFVTVDGNTVNGFSIVTEFEQIDDTGKYISEKNRFNTLIERKDKPSFFARFLPRTRKVGKYRFFAFVVSGSSYSGKGGRSLSADKVQSSFMGTSTQLHQKMIDQPINEVTKFQILVYEYEFLEDDKQLGYPTKIESLNLDHHLKGSNIFNLLFKSP